MSITLWSATTGTGTGHQNYKYTKQNYFNWSMQTQSFIKNLLLLLPLAAL